MEALYASVPRGRRSLAVIFVVFLLVTIAVFLPWLSLPSSPSFRRHHCLLGALPPPPPPPPPSSSSSSQIASHNSVARGKTTFRVLNCSVFFCMVRDKEVEMNGTEPTKKASLPQIVKLDKAFKLWCPGEITMTSFRPSFAFFTSAGSSKLSSEFRKIQSRLCVTGCQAEAWVSNMSKVEDDEPTEADKEGRSSRLGLGARISRQCKVGPLNDPVERKLYAKLDAKKRKAAQIAEDSRSARDSIEDEDIADEDSRTNAFVKKAALPFSLSIKGNKKRK
ncbi:uncharacterized protein G2W53_024467 [Senna tora]|uniref:Uncharacterized protein n=1 Tax=Senna tora TaxID=362788 RepID=A0A834TBM0_9FABA|nr:uncharacterized protein G2W53_024467 [Senna tora]